MEVSPEEFSVHLGSNPGGVQGNRSAEALGKAHFGWVSEPVSCNASESRAGLERTIAGRRLPPIEGRPMREGINRSVPLPARRGIGNGVRGRSIDATWEARRGEGSRPSTSVQLTASAGVGEAHGTEEAG